MTQTRTGRETAKVRDHVKRLELTLRDQKFDGEDTIKVLAFLAEFVRECNTLSISEGQAYVALPYLLKGSAKEQFLAARTIDEEDDGGVTCWPEAVQYLLRTYATSNAIRDAILALRDTRQREDEGERVYAARLSKAAARCGNVHSSEEKTTMYVDGLKESIKSLVARYRETERRATYLEVIQFACAEGDALRGRRQTSQRGGVLQAGRITVPNRGNPKSRERHPTALLAESIADTNENGDYSTQEGEGVLLGGEGTSNPTTDLPTGTWTTGDEDPALPMYGRDSRPSHGRVSAPPVAYQDNRVRFTRPGWEQRPMSPRAMSAPKNNGIICHICYVRNAHTAPNCDLTLRDQWKVVGNYESLNDTEKERVPAESYERAKAVRSARETESTHQKN